MSHATVSGAPTIHQDAPRRGARTSVRFAVGLAFAFGAAAKGSLSTQGTQWGWSEAPTLREGNRKQRRVGKTREEMTA